MRSRIIIAAVVLLVAGACAGGQTDSPVTTAASADPTSAVETTSDTEPTDTTNDNPTVDLPFESGQGHFEIDGQRYDPEFIVSCIVPEDFYGDPPHPESLEIWAFQAEAGEALEVTITVEDVESMANPGTGYKATWLDVFHHRRGADGAEQFQGVAVNDPDGNWYLSEHLVPRLIVDGQEPQGPALEPPVGFILDGNRITGTLMLMQSWPEGSGEVLAMFDFTIPSEPYDCDEL